MTDNPHIFSNGYHFRFSEHDNETGFGYIVPQWVNPPEGLDLTQTNIILPLTRSGFGYDKIKEMLLEIEPETILFLSKLQEIRIKTDSGTDFAILKNDDSRPEVELLVEGNNQHRSFSKVDRFLVCIETANKPADLYHEKREGIENREISIAFPLDGDFSCAGKIFAYLPVRSDTGFPFLINADFILPSSREDIQHEPWNHWLMDCVADLVATLLLPALKERELLTTDFLEKLASRLNDFGEGVHGVSFVVDRDSLFLPIFARVRTGFMKEELLPANDGTFVSRSNAKLARGEPIRELLHDGQLASLFSSNHEIKWLSDKITQDRTHELWQYLRYELKIEEVDPEMFARRLSENFLYGQNDAWFVDFYKFLTSQRALWIYSNSTLRSRPILRLQDGTHVIPPCGEGSSPTAYLSKDTDTDTSFPIIKVDLTQDEEVRGFLRELGVQEWNIVDDVIEHILPKYERNDSPISVAEHSADIEKIRRAYSTDSQTTQTNRTRLRDRLLETPFILTEKTHTEKATYCEPNQLYFPSDELRLYFEDNDSCAFVNLDVYSPLVTELLKELGVADNVKVTTKEPNREGYVDISNSHGWHVRGLSGFDPYIEADGLEHGINAPTPEKSSYIWNEIARRYISCIIGTIETATKKTYENKEEQQMTSQFGELLIETAWLPDSAGNMHKPCELTLDDLPESFVRDASLAEQLGMKKDEEAELAEKVGIPVEWIEVLKEAPREVLSSPETLERIKELVGREDLVKRPVTNSRSREPEFPESPVNNPDYRAAKIDEDLNDSPAVEFEPRQRSVRLTAPREAARVWLMAEYTNNDEQMICQICKKEMPFKKRDGEYYFESVEALNKEQYPIEHETQFLALCPECAARYKEFIKKDEDAMRKMIDQLKVSENMHISLRLGDLNTTLRFVEKHWRDIRQILKNFSENAFRQ